ncbi:MAG: pentapeptide repeat-containing protein, partial [Cyanobacteriota bacterium]|nr:pentapeptide repeat-containing protein [Cyanobacteriota bacterium]
MNAPEILNAYQQGRRDFRGQSLRGCNFARLAQKLPNGQRQGVDLSGADLSGCDIRGANFSYANLTGTKFEQAQAGLQRRWVAILW